MGDQSSTSDYADRWAGVLRLELTVFVDNTPAIALYRKFGFEIEGTNRAFALRDGTYLLSTDPNFDPDGDD